MFATLPMLRRRALFGILIFAAFSTLWTTLAFHLSARAVPLRQPGHRSVRLVGAAGVLAANVAGRNADQAAIAPDDHRRRRVDPLSFVVLYVGRNVVVVLAIGIVVLDAGMQGLQITNQSIIYSLAPDARSRINSAYMVCAFIGAASAPWPPASVTRTPDGAATVSWVAASDWRSWSSRSVARADRDDLASASSSDRAAHGHRQSPRRRRRRVRRIARAASSAISRRSSSVRMIAPEYVPKSDTSSSIAPRPRPVELHLGLDVEVALDTQVGGPPPRTLAVVLGPVAQRDEWRQPRHVATEPVPQDEEPTVVAQHARHLVRRRRLLEPVPRRGDEHGVEGRVARPAAPRRRPSACAPRDFGERGPRACRRRARRR